MKRPAFLTLLAVLAALAVPGCSPLSDDSYLRPATLQFYTNPAELTAPASAVRNLPFDVEFTSYGGGCVERARSTVGSTGLDVRIWAWQRVNVPGQNGACTDELRIERNVVRVTVTQAGAARIRVFGQQEPGGDPFVLEAQVTVTP